MGDNVSNEIGKLLLLRRNHNRYYLASSGVHLCVWLRCTCGADALSAALLIATSRIAEVTLEQAGDPVIVAFTSAHFG